MVEGTKLGEAFEERLNRNGGQRGKIRLDAALEIEVVVDLRNSGIVREAVSEIERTDPCFDLVRRYQRRGNVRRQFHLWRLRNRRCT